MSTIKLYRHALSGHSHHVEAFLSLLNLPAEIINVDLANGAHKQPEFLKKNIFGQVPVIEDHDTTLSDSNAILIYLAAKYDTENKWLPRDPKGAAEVQSFLSLAASKIANGPAAARLVNVFGANLDHEAAKLSSHATLTILEEHLTDRKWLVGLTPSIADIANYAYIAIISIFYGYRNIISNNTFNKPS